MGVDEGNLQVIDLDVILGTLVTRKESERKLEARNYATIYIDKYTNSGEG